MFWSAWQTTRCVRIRFKPRAARAAQARGAVRGQPDAAGAGGRVRAAAPPRAAPRAAHRLLRPRARLPRCRARGLAQRLSHMRKRVQAVPRGVPPVHGRRQARGRVQSSPVQLCRMAAVWQARAMRAQQHVHAAAGHADAAMHRLGPLSRACAAGGCVLSALIRHLSHTDAEAHGPFPVCLAHSCDERLYTLTLDKAGQALAGTATPACRSAKTPSCSFTRRQRLPTRSLAAIKTKVRQDDLAGPEKRYCCTSHADSKQRGSGPRHAGLREP